MLESNEPIVEERPHVFDVEKCVAEKMKENYFVKREDDDPSWCRHFFRIKICPLHDAGCTSNAWMNAQCQSCISKQMCLNYLKWHWIKSDVPGLVINPSR